MAAAKTTGFSDFSQVDMLGLWYTSVNFGAKKDPVSRNGRTQIDCIVRDVSDTMHLLISFRMSTSPQNRQLDVLISNSEKHIYDFVRDFFKND